MTFRETGNVRLVLEAWQTKTLKRSSLVRDLYTIRLTITPPPAPRLRVTSSVESKITPLCHQVTLGKGIPIHRKKPQLLVLFCWNGRLPEGRKVGIPLEILPHIR